MNPLLGLFPAGTELGDDGMLVVGGCRLDEVAEEFGTPTLVVAEDALRARAREYLHELRSRWPKTHVVFASKAFPARAVQRVVTEEGLGLDVAGGGELLSGVAAGADPSTFVMHGNAKTSEEIALAVEHGLGLVVVDNLDDIDRLEAIVPAGRRQSCLVRVIPGVQASTHSSQATGHEGAKFGLMPEAAREAIARIEASPRLHMEGLHTHVGSQILNADEMASAVAPLARLGTFATYDLGGGLGVRYTYAEHPPTVAEYAEALVAQARALLPADARLIVEPGRSMVAATTTTVYRVTTVKRGVVTHVAVDGGMGDNLDVSLTGQRFEATIANRLLDVDDTGDGGGTGGGGKGDGGKGDGGKGDGGKGGGGKGDGGKGDGELVSVVGRHCESGDVLSDGVRLSAPAVGDLLAVPVTGAYCFTMSNTYNGARRIPVVFASGGQARLVVRRDTWADLAARDVD